MLHFFQESSIFHILVRRNVWFFTFSTDKCARIERNVVFFLLFLLKLPVMLCFLSGISLNCTGNVAFFTENLLFLVDWNINVVFFSEIFLFSGVYT